MSKNSDKITDHPCFSETAHYKYGRIHLPVAPKCNIKCRYCESTVGCINENRPGVCTEVIGAKQAIERVENELKEDFNLNVVAVAGPGEPLYNDATFETLKGIHEKYPDLRKCISTNGLLLSEKVDLLHECGVGTVTVTVNTLSEKVATKIYRYVNYEGVKYTELEATKLLILKQWEGIEKAINKGIKVKINTILIPGINEDYIVDIAKKAKNVGAYIMNITPIIPLGEFREIEPPDKELMRKIRDESEKYIKQFHLCKQCRADAVGIPGMT